MEKEINCQTVFSVSESDIVLENLQLKPLLFDVSLNGIVKIADLPETSTWFLLKMSKNSGVMIEVCIFTNQFLNYIKESLWKRISSNLSKFLDTFNYQERC